ncbi:MULTISPECIES: 23S rRNA (adenine(1618)-N(6))-methyltransferase RlmF [Sodalis]|jgi:23S rRNA (adenine1618-N6)-methyltransferase|uniref:Ribosomal RNA large subunit methyltransferase F n=1 Tax=Sodalis ligni TaxID=2697027 RepID=A0A4R1NES1_9GAMM|nr:23S rRNA (adenine(1618)-N(6))-methyltransferase RlmF [Sodalis ligni]TCL04201.1 23S rRNA m(6)A-1618 methyltransferase [Sodalis ligni]
MEHKKTFPQQKNHLHPRNRHRSRYDFDALIGRCPALAPFVKPNAWGDISVDFADPAAVKMLNKALLLHYYGIEHWDIPANYLCPPIPGRADYIHYLADLLADGNGQEIPRGKNIAILDVGVGASCIYPIIGQHEYGWRFTGSENDKISLNSAKMLVEMNPTLRNSVRLRHQKQSDAIFDNIIGIAERFDATICNPPFHGSAEEARASTRLKLHKLGKGEVADTPVQNFGGKNNELWCEGGELAFVGKMVEESVGKGKNCLWFTSLISKHTTLPPLYEALKLADAYDVRTIDMAQGQKISRFIAWTFQNAEQQAQWAAERWQKPE